jgi:hypothetical protein
MNWPVVIAAVFFVGVAGATQMRTSERTPFALFVTGDDGLTNRFSDGLLDALLSSPSLVSSEIKPGTLKISITHNVMPRRVGGRLQIEYDVEFNMDDRTLAVSRGACFENELDACVVSVMSALKTVVETLQR